MAGTDTGDANNYFQKNDFFDKVKNPFFNSEFFKLPFFFQPFFGEEHGGTTNPPPPTNDDVLDLDGDGKPDEVLDTALDATVTQDDDSINVDINNDGIADIVIPKKKKKKSKKKDK